MSRKVITAILDILLVIGAFTTIATIDGGRGLSNILIDLVPAESAAHQFFAERALPSVGAESSCSAFQYLSSVERRQLERYYARHGVKLDC